MLRLGQRRFGAREIRAHSIGINRRTALRMVASAAGIAVIDAAVRRRTASAARIGNLEAHVVAVNIPGASALAEVGAFLTTSPFGSPIPTRFPEFVKPGAVLDPIRILVGGHS